MICEINWKNFLRNNNHLIKSSTIVHRIFISWQVYVRSKIGIDIIDVFL